MTYKKRKFVKKLNRNIYIGIFCIAAIFFWYNAGHKFADTSDHILDVSVSNNDVSDVVGISADEKKFVASDGSSDADEDANSDTDTETDTDENDVTVNPLYEGMFIVNVEGYLNIRSQADENSEILGKLYAGAGGEVIENGEEWTKIKSGDVEGYVKTEYIILGTQSTTEIEDAIVSIATVNTETLKVRAEESTDSNVISMVAKGDELICTSESTSDDWVGVQIDDKKGYVSANYVVVSKKLKEAVSIEQERAEKEAEAAAKAAAEAQAAEQAAAEAATQATAQEETTAKQTTVTETTTQASEKQTEKSTAKANSTSTVNSKPTSTTTDETYLLACLVYCEAGSEPYEGKLAVANVVLNRLRAGWGSSISDIIYASGQFPPATNGILDGVIASGPNADSTKAAKAALAGTNNVSGYYHFCAASAVDYESFDNYLLIGNQVFY